MRNRSLSELFGVLSIVLPGGVAAFVVARTLSAYWGRDWLASVIVAAIGAALALGLLELFARLLRAGQLERELRSLPPVPSEATIDAASPRLSAMLRARLEQVPLTNTGEGSASFLTGLLVMLGLLGTLLGLFQTVSGAGHALTSSADIDALRRSLSAPIDGLTRSFGCSAAGISASAMLGLAIALVRRREVRALRMFYAYATGPLRALSPTRRQMRALEQLVDQGIALPSAASALEGVGLKLGDLSNQLISLQQAALKSQQRAFSDLLASVRGEFTKAAGETGEALHARVSPLLEQMATRSGEALVAQAGALSESAREITRQIESDAQTRREAAAAATEALQTRFDEAERVRATARAQELEALTGLSSRVERADERREQAFSARWSELIGRFDAQLMAARQSEGERQRSLDELTCAARDRDVQTLGRLDEVTTRVGSELQQLASALGSQLDQRATSERSHDARAERTLSQLTAAAAALEQGMMRQTQAVEQSFARQAEVVADGMTRQTQAVEHSLARQAEIVEQNVARQSGAIEQSVARQTAAIEQGITRQNAALAQSVAGHATALDESVRLQASALEHSGARQIEALELAVTRLQSTLDASVAHQAEVVEGGVARQVAVVEQSVARQEHALTRQAKILEESVSHQAEVVEGGIARQVEVVEQSVGRQEHALTRQAQIVEASIAHQAEVVATGIAQHAAILEQTVARQNDAIERGSSRQADVLDSALARQSSGLEDLTARVKALLPQLADAAQAGAVDTFARLRELAEAQAAQFSALEAAIERGRAEHTAGLGEQLASHASDLEQRLARTSTAVQDAAAIWQASSAEMQSVAELFANSVERQREASDAWLESLGEVDGAVERAGRDAARDALSEQLASTQEVFARQLQFQRELFEQLRTLRAAPSGVSNGEHDVSV